MSDKIDKGGFMKPSEHRILIVDSDPLNREALSADLNEKGFRVSMAENKAQALEVINEKTPDLILLDIIMPQTDGVHVLKQLKSDPDLMHVPVIVISAPGNSADVVKCIELGAEDYISKPFETVFLHARIKAGLNKTRMRKQEEELAQTRIRVAMETGRAQQAALALYNVGNAMPGASSAAQSLERLSSRSILNLLSKCHDELKNNHCMLELFFHDEKAGKFFGYMGELIGDLNIRSAQIIKAHDQISTSINSISQILTLQQNYPTDPNGSIEEIDLNSMVQDLLLVQQPVLNKHHISIRKKISNEIPLVKTDKGRLMQAAANLIRNSCEAFKADFFQGYKRKLTIETGMDEGKAFLRFEDNGAGIPKEFLQKVFDFDYSTKGAFGYGLYYCKQFLESIGGRIQINSGHKTTQVTLFPEAQIS